MANSSLDLPFLSLNEKAWVTQTTRLNQQSPLFHCFALPARYWSIFSISIFYILSIFIIGAFLLSCCLRSSSHIHRFCPGSIVYFFPLFPKVKRENGKRWVTEKRDADIPIASKMFIHRRECDDSDLGTVNYPHIEASLFGMHNQCKPNGVCSWR